jgi:hypothetical protein
VIVVVDAEPALGRILFPDAIRFSPGVVHFASRAIGALWARSRTDRRMKIRFARRRLVDHLAAAWLPRQARVVVAPSGGAERVFAVAKERGLSTVLVHDLPCMRELQEDLDEAARRYPDCAFLRRFRAPRELLTRQEAERVLADQVLVRGRYAEQLLIERGVAASRIVRLTDPRPAGTAQPAAKGQERAHPRGGRLTLLLAGLATARAGTNEALHALERRPDLTLLVRPGEGTEPLRLLAHPQVRIASVQERKQLAGVDVVLAPAWCESHPEEVVLAFARAIPVVATTRAAGDGVPTHTVEPGDTYALGRAIDALCGAER